MSRLTEIVKARGAWRAAAHGLQRVGHDWVAEDQNNPLTPSLFPFLMPPSLLLSLSFSQQFLPQRWTVSWSLFYSFQLSHTFPWWSNPFFCPAQIFLLTCMSTCPLNIFLGALHVGLLHHVHGVFSICQNCSMSGKDLGTSHCPCLKESSHVSPFLPQSNSSGKMSPLLFSCSGSNSDPQKIWSSRTHECNVILKKSLCR